MSRGLGDRQRRLLCWMQEQIDALAAGGVYYNGFWHLVALEGAQVQGLGLPRYRMANVHIGPKGSAAELEATRRAIRTLQDRNLIAETEIQLGRLNQDHVCAGLIRAEDDLRRARREPTRISCYILQPEGAEPIERWKTPEHSRMGLYRDAIFAHVTTEPQQWLELEPAMLQMAESLAVERFGEHARWVGQCRSMLINVRQRLEGRGRLIVDRGEWGETTRQNGYMVCTVRLP